MEDNFLSRLRSYFQSHQSNDSYVPNSNSSPRVVHHHYDSGPSWWWWFWPRSSPTYNYNYNYGGSTTNQSSSSRSRNNRDEDQKDKSNNVTLGKISSIMALMGVTLGGFYYFYNQYLDYRDEEELKEELNNYQRRHPYLYSMASNYLDNSLEYRKNSLFSQVMVTGSLVGLVCDWLFWNDEFWMYLTLGSAFIGAGHGIFHYLNYRRKNHQVDEILDHINRIKNQQEN